MAALDTAVTAKRRGRGLSLLFPPAIGWLWLFTLVLLGLTGFPVRRHHFEAAGIAFGFACLLAVALHPGGLRVIQITQSRRAAWTVAVLPAATAVAAFSWSIDLGPLSDDFVLSRWASTGDFAAGEWSHFRPLPLALWRVALAEADGQRCTP